jgi:hypothetical protein
MTATRPPPRDPRPDLTGALERLLRAIAAHDAFDVDVDAIVLVGLAAHGLAAASVRPLKTCAQSVVIDKTRRTLELGLRPPFFLDGDAPTRLCTLCHELLHIAGEGMREENRHIRKSHDALEDEARAIAGELLARLDPKEVLCLAHDGEVLLRAWRHRPTEQTQLRPFTDDDCFRQPVRMVTPLERRGGWW